MPDRENFEKTNLYLLDVSILSGGETEFSQSICEGSGWPVAA
jgi:hypothetical protein